MAQTLKELVAELQFKISLIDRQIVELERLFTKNDSHVSELHTKLEKIKDEINEVKRINLDGVTRSVADIEREIESLQKEIDILRLEMPEMRLIKKIVLGLVAFILTAFLGLLWNTVINSSAKKSNENVEEIVKKLSQEYKKGP